jgi:anti-anti-sigma regulatory factor/HAMP domain-containing protein
MGIGVALVIVAVTGVSYLHAIRSFTAQSLNGLNNYIRTRAEREQWVFDLAISNLEAVSAEIVYKIHEYSGVDPWPEFDRRNVAISDGVIRPRPERFDPRRDAAVVLNPPALLDAALMRRVLGAQDAIEQMGRAMHTRFQNTWMVMPENVSIGYWPEAPRWPFEISASTNFTTGTTFTLARPEENPERRPVWTGVYRDRTMDIVMTSAALPVYDGDRFVGVVGQDVMVKELLERTVNVALQGTYNVIVHQDGDLIAHPSFTDRIKASPRDVHVSKMGDGELEAIYRAALAVTGDAVVAEEGSGRFYLGVMRLRGPGWYLITVYPKALLQEEAFQVARFVLLAGLLSLLFEVVILYWVLRSRVAAPLRTMLSATEKVTAGDMNVELDTRRDDELGRLAVAFTKMTHAVRDREDFSRRVEQSLRRSEKELAELLQSEIEKSAALARLNNAVDALSTPVLEIRRDVLALPLIGTIDERRSTLIRERLLAAVVRKRCRYVIIDITGVAAIDAEVAEGLLKTVAAARMLGAYCVITGVRPSAAMTLVTLGVDLPLVTRRSLEDGLRECIKQISRGHHE